MRAPIASTSKLSAVLKESGVRQSQLDRDVVRSFRAASFSSSSENRAPASSSSTAFIRRGGLPGYDYRKKERGATQAPDLTKQSEQASRLAAMGAARTRGSSRSSPSDRRATSNAVRFMFGAKGRRVTRQTNTHDWVNKPPASHTADRVQAEAAGEGKPAISYLEPLDLSKSESRLAIVPEETRDGVATRSWWRLAPEPEPLSADEEAGDYSRWTSSFFAKQAPRTNPAIPSWTEILDRTLPRNRSMTLGQKKLFAKTVEQLVAGNGVIKAMSRQSYVSPVRPWPTTKKAKIYEDPRLVQRIPWWRKTYRPLIAANV